MRATWLLPLLVLSVTAFTACNDKGGDTGDTGDSGDSGDAGDAGDSGNFTTLTGALAIDLVGASAACQGTWDADGTASSSNWCPDCTLQFDTTFSLTASSGGCSFEDFDRSIGYWPNYSGSTSIIVYPDGGSLYYWGVAYLSGNSLAWVQVEYGYTYGYAPYYDYYYAGAATLN